MNDRRVSKRIIDGESSILEALKLMDKIDKKLLLVYKKNQFINILSIGDIQRAIIANQTLETRVESIVRSKTKLGKTGDSSEVLKNKMLKYRIECLPVVNNSNDIVHVLFWEDIFTEKVKSGSNLGLPIIIMAGGKGTRLKPLTNVIPKPLIPIGEKTIIEEIMENFIEVGCDQFHLSVNYKASTIIQYFKDLPRNYKVEYFMEDKPLGTAGSLFLLKGKMTKPFFVTNCDIIINADYSEIYKYHKQNKNKITIVAALKNYAIPYGTIESGKNGLLKDIREKPDLTFKINTGMYILEPEILDEIPNNQFYNITELIMDLNKRNEKVGVFPINEGAWIDIGEWNEYTKIIGI